MHYQRITIIIISILGMFATFLPWIVAPIVGSVSGTGGDGWFTFAFFGLAALISIIGKRQAIINTLPSVIIGLLGFFGLIMGFWKILIVNRIKSELINTPLFGEMMTAGTQVGSGLYLLILTGGALLVLTIFFLIKNKRGSKVVSLK